MSLEIDVAHRLGGFALEVGFRAEPGLTALFGRSGAGKTTLINIVAGLIRPDRGRVAVDGTVLVDRDRDVFLPPHRRRIGYVFQDGRLFPHLSVRQNLGYGRWFTPRAEPAGDFEHIVALLGIAPLLDRRPASLSGGEQQRVAIGRALLAGPRVLLLDEPLAALDNQRRAEILPYVERLRDETRIPILYVTHAVPEMIRLATTLVVLSAGRVEAAGSVAEVMGRLDMFPLTGRHESGAVLEARVDAYDPGFGLTTLAVAGGALRVPGRIAEPGGLIRLHIRARDVLIAMTPPVGLSALNVLAGTVVEISAGEGPILDLRLDCGGAPLIARLTRRSIATLGLAPGRPVYAVIKSIAFDRSSVGGPVEVDT